MQYQSLTFDELQRAALTGDDVAVMELGRRMIDFDFDDWVHKDEVPCWGDCNVYDEEVENVS